MSVVVEKPHVIDLPEEGRRSSGVAGSGGEDEEQRCESESSTEIEGATSDKEKKSSVSECSVEAVDLEFGIPEVKVHLSKVKKDCRICHLSFDATNQDSELPFELGCSCKDDLAAAHKHCAEAWFKIKGNK